MRRATLILVAVILGGCSSAEPATRPMPTLAEKGPITEAVPPPSPSTSLVPRNSQPAPETSTGSTPSDLPDVTVVDLAGGEFRLASLAPSDRPIVLWFWAPH